MKKVTTEPWVEDREHDLPAIEIPVKPQAPEAPKKKSKVFDWLFARDEGSNLAKMNELRKKALLIRGPKNSDKYLDIENLGINHSAYESKDFETLALYLRALEAFQRKHSWLYDVEGQFNGPENLRPKKEGDL